LTRCLILAPGIRFRCILSPEIVHEPPGTACVLAGSQIPMRIIYESTKELRLLAILLTDTVSNAKK
jgi:hypothetical protein